MITNKKNLQNTLSKPSPAASTLIGELFSCYDPFFEGFRISWFNWQSIFDQLFLLTWFFHGFSLEQCKQNSLISFVTNTGPPPQMTPHPESWLTLCKRTLNHLAKLAKWFSCVASTYLYSAFDCMFLSCHVRVSEWIHTL